MPKDLTDWGIPEVCCCFDFGGARPDSRPISDATGRAATPLGKLESTMLLFKYPPVTVDCDEFSTAVPSPSGSVAGLYWIDGYVFFGVRCEVGCPKEL